jgi:hypothetical protein
MKFLIFLLCLLVLVVAGCNIFSWTTASDEELYYEGIKLFNAEKFAEAKIKFAEAREKDPLRSDYRYYHAKATIFEADINFLSVGRDVIQPQKLQSQYFLPLYTQSANMTLAEDAAYKNKIYQIISICHDDIHPIFKNETHGELKKQDILFEYSLFALAMGILQLRDTNNDGVIDANDFYFSIYSASGSDVKYHIYFPPNFDQKDIVNTVKDAILFFGDGSLALTELFFSDYIDTGKLGEIMTQIETELNFILP